MCTLVVRDEDSGVTRHVHVPGRPFRHHHGVKRHAGELALVDAAPAIAAVLRLEYVAFAEVRGRHVGSARLPRMRFDASDLIARDDGAGHISTPGAPAVQAAIEPAVLRTDANSPR